MKRWFRYHPQTILFAIMIMAGIIFNPQATAAFRYLTEGMDAPDVKGKDLATGEMVSSRELSKDNLVIIIFWSTWSARSLEQLKDMSDLYRDFSTSPIKMIAVNVDGPQLSNAARLAVETTVKNLKLSFPVIIDENLDIFYQYGTSVAFPSGLVNYMTHN